MPFNFPCYFPFSLYVFYSFPLSLLIGDGKTHLIKTRLRNRLPHMVLHIPVNEAFTPLSAVKKLQMLPMDTRGCCIYFNFTVLPPSVSYNNDYRGVIYCIVLYMFGTHLK